MSDVTPTPSPSTDDFGRRLGPADQLVLLWEQGTRVDVDAFLETVDPLSASDLAAVLHVDQHHRWQTGERPPVESYLRRFPDICADAEAVVDVIFYEYLLRERLGECPKPEEYSDRFPAYAEALQSQIAFHRLVQASDGPLAEPPPAMKTVSIPAPDELPGSAPAIGLVARGGMSSSREVQSLIRRRLRLLSIISCVAFLLYLPVLWTVLAGSWGVAVYVAVVVETAVFAVLLSSRRAYSVAALRRIEAAIFAGLLLFFVWQTVEFFRASSLDKLAAFGWIGPIMAARNVSWSWAVMIIVYGIWIPNTTRRCIVVVVAMVGTFLALTCGLAMSVASVPQSAIAGFLLCAATDILFAAAIAIFGAYRIQSLQQAVSESRKLGPYRLVRRLGGGGMGEVYLAEHALLRRPCALKLIRKEQCGDDRVLTRFEREVQTMATLTHPNTVRVYDYGLSTDGTFYYAMEYLSGLSLQELVTQHGPLPAERVVHLLRQVCGALHEAHAVGLVHRDIKPANILACQYGGQYDVAKLLDFGLVRVHAHGGVEKSLTGIGSIAGTPAFMSPEQAAGVAAVDLRSDIYSLGAVAYFLLSGRPPHLHATSVETMAAHLTEDVVPLRHVLAAIPADLEAVVLTCLEKEPGRRFTDVTALEEALAKCACEKGWSLKHATEWWRNRMALELL